MALPGELEFYAANSGLTLATLNDHKAAYFRAQSGLANASLQDAELAFLRSGLPGVAGTLNDLRLAYYAGMSPLASGTLSDHMAAVFATGCPFSCSVRGSPGVVSVGKSSFVQPSSRSPKIFHTSRLRRDWNMRT